MASSTLDSPEAANGHDGPLDARLARALGASLLPSEQAEFDAERLAEAARFTLATAAQRAGDAPAIAIESLSGQRALRIAVINDDQPFLVDSIAATVSSLGLTIERLLHPVVAVRRNPQGALIDLPAGDAIGELRESMIYIETDRADARERRALAQSLAATLADVHAAVADWPQMQARMNHDARGLPDAEGAALLRWLAEAMLTQLGHVVRQRDGALVQPLGVCRSSDEPLLSDTSYARAFAWFDRAGESGGEAVRAPLAIKSNRIGRVHRREPLDLFLVPVLSDGRVVALSVHAGIWTSAALSAPPDRVPRMRSQLETLMRKLGFTASGHAGKSLTHALTALPHDLLISFADEDLERVATTMMALIDRPRPRLVLVRSPLDRHVFVFVWIPRDVLSTDMREEIAELVERGTGGVVRDWSLEVEGNRLALLRFVVDARELAQGSAEGEVIDEAALDARLQLLVRGWEGAVEAELAQSEEASRAMSLAARYANAFPVAYRAGFGAAEAARDIRVLRGLDAHAAPRRAARLHRLADDEGVRLKLYQREGAIVLSDAVPVLENFGFRVLEEVPTALDGGKLGFIHDFLVALPADTNAEALLARAAVIEAALAAVLNGGAEDDEFNALIVDIGVSAREANWLRAWYRYLRQVGWNYGIPTTVDALHRAPVVTHGLIALFVARHDPAFTGDRAEAETQAHEAIRRGLAGVAAINDDRLLRALAGMIGAILRTNAFAPAGEQALAFKFASQDVPGLPKPLPWREIFVYSARVEGIHLRAGPVARGGLRWSDRRDDFRTEILGLMKAQRVKNAVIVPTGAKGGFYPKRLPDPARDREGWAAEGKASYQLFIRTLLSLTDNIVDGAVVHPAGVVIRDGEDPYFVVAADKGTATFSDVANAIAAEHDFWLDDAFASGGSKGYDHKAMGITARGAWISVQRHFLERGIDVQSDPVRVVGVGDMSGDVFGNGMLLSRSLRVIAAFDHRHIFLDPAPDPAVSWAERARLFALPRSSWDDYNKALISPGGGVFPRSLKAIPLGEAIRAELAIAETELDPETLISRILTAPVDLLWFGGIGTYVKAAHEVHAAVGDPANDGLRVDARQLRVAVIGEGANLGMTQAARIEAGLAGIKGNTDFIDNSAGVDCSDNEVNIKIALASAKRAGRLDEDGRVALLTSMTDAVGEIVLEDNRLQALGLSIAERGGAAAVPALVRLIDVLEAGGDLDRATEGLGTDEDYARRAANGQGFTRPELAVLLSTTKLVIQQALENSSVVDDPSLESFLFNAFPPAMRETFAEDIRHHRLRREIIATKVANRVINNLGPVHPFELAEEEGVGVAQVVAAFLVAEQLLDLGGLWAALDTLALPEALRLDLFERTARGLRAHIADALRSCRDGLSPGALVRDLAPGLAELRGELGDLIRGENAAAAERLAGELAAAGTPDTVVGQLVALYNLEGAIGLARLARDLALPTAPLTRAFADLGDRLGLDWAQQAASRMLPSDAWERLLTAGLARDFQQMRLEFLRRRADGDPEAAVEAWLRSHAGESLPALIARARATPRASAAMLAHVASQARATLLR